MRKTAIILMWVIFVTSSCNAQKNPNELPECNWCGTDEAPANLTSHVVIAPADEPGVRITIRGKFYQSDGKTPAAGVIVYLYHTNAKGLYEKKGNETGNGKRHGYLRAWLKSSSDGSYAFETIRPASYPNGTEAQHIHITVKSPGKQEIALDSFLFDDDPLLTAERKKRLKQVGDSGSGILSLKNVDGMTIGYRDIVLPN
ncbi:intradiol ring-cleavage dioxygenase [bacterium]|nr:intradiol ring-cleavage dioxygenase [bacterium]